MAGNMSKAERDDRLQRLELLIEKGIPPFPARLQFERTHINEILDSFDTFESEKKVVAIAGRLKSKRVHGKLLFGELEDATGKVQLYVKEDTIGKEGFSFLCELIDIGDILLAQGVCTKTQRGERSLLVSQTQLLAKSLQPLPEKWHGLKDIETRFRKRELDFISNPEAKNIFLLRSKMLEAMRAFLHSQHFIEVETPILQSIPGGATARPFVTHHNALNQDLYLRVAPELFLKRLIVGGFERVFEVAKCFRNEGIDTEHNPEFTQIELYVAYWDYQRLMEFTQECITEVVIKTLGTDTFPFEKETITLKPPFQRISFYDSLKKIGHCDITPESSLSEILASAKNKKVKVDPAWGKGKILDELFKECVRPHLIQPVFITDHPIELSPLAKKSEASQATVERFQLCVAKTELVNAFSELNDPIDQKARFEEQENLRKKGDDEAQYFDEDYIDALEHGMPPTAGLGIGIDRLMTLLTNSQSIKEVISFPTLRSKKI